MLKMYTIFIANVFSTINLKAVVFLNANHKQVPTIQIT